MQAIIRFKHQRHARSKAKARGAAPPPANSAATANAKRTAPAPKTGTAATAPEQPWAARRAPAAVWRPDPLPASTTERLSSTLKATASIPFVSIGFATSRSSNEKIAKSAPP